MLSSCRRRRYFEADEAWPDSHFFDGMKLFTRGDASALSIGLQFHNGRAMGRPREALERLLHRGEDLLRLLAAQTLTHWLLEARSADAAWQAA